MKTLVNIFMVLAVTVGLLNCANQNKKPVAAVVNSLQSVYYDYDQSFIRSDAVGPMQGNAGFLKNNSIIILLRFSFAEQTLEADIKNTA